MCQKQEKLKERWSHVTLSVLGILMKRRKNSGSKKKSSVEFAAERRRNPRS